MKDILGSKKFLYAVSTALSIFITHLTALDAEQSAALSTSLVIIGSVLIIGQGCADIGKESEREKTRRMYLSDLKPTDEDMCSSICDTCLKQSGKKGYYCREANKSFVL